MVKLVFHATVCLEPSGQTKLDPYPVPPNPVEYGLEKSSESPNTGVNNKMSAMEMRIITTEICDKRIELKVGKRTRYGGHD
jgi:hypothetical protein